VPAPPADGSTDTLVQSRDGAGFWCDRYAAAARHGRCAESLIAIERRRHDEQEREPSQSCAAALGVVLAGHACGSSITEAADGQADVKALVYVSARSASEGESVAQLPSQFD